MEDVFELLTLANTLEESGGQRIEAATKYYEAVYLIRTHAQKLPLTRQHADTRRLLTDKASHYEQIAKELLNDDSSTTAKAISPRSPLAKETFFGEDSSVAPLTAPLPSTMPKSSLSPSLRLVNLQSLADRANAQLSMALDLDEQGRQQQQQQQQQRNNSAKESVIQAYMAAAELYLQAIHQQFKGSDNHTQQHDDGDPRIRQLATILTRRLEQTLDRVEQLKHQKSLVAQDRVGFEISANKPVEQQHVSKESSPPSSRLSQEEVHILKRSSLMASGLFLPWSEEEAAQLNQQAAMATASTKQAALYTDPQGSLRLNARQQQHFYKWARPNEIVQMRRRAGHTRTTQPIHVVHTITPYSIRQQHVTDCSFIASLCICAAFERRFGKQLVSSMLYPQQREQSVQSNAGSTNIRTMPFVNPAGKYMVKLWLNGVARSVTIDDTLPVDKYGNLLCSVNNHSGQSNSSCASCLELWVPLIEKAYMKLCGGYDFPGSNSGVDLFSLTGWIPERILFAQDPNRVRDFETAPERVWDRIFGASAFGDCLVTVSTDQGAVTREQVTETGLVTGHAYAVLNVVQTKNNTRLLLLKNPWGRQEWRGKYSCYDEASWAPSLCAEVGYRSNADAKREDGVFWISWEDILQHFQNFHLSWNPQLFGHRAVRHGFWPKEVAPNDDSFNIGENPQYLLLFSDAAAKRRATVWILVSRHIDKQEQEGSEVNDYLTVHIHRNSERNRRIWYPGRHGNCVLTGAYTNNPHVLVRYDLQGLEDRYLSLVLSQYRKSNDLGYTVCCYGTEPFTLTRPAKDLPYMVQIYSQWTEEKSGGPLGTKTAHINPQFAVAVPVGRATIQISVATSRTCAVCFVLAAVTSFGKIVTTLTSKPIIDTGKYRHGFVVSERHLVAHGFYTLLVTNFDRGKIASFEVKVSSSARLHIKEIE